MSGNSRQLETQWVRNLKKGDSLAFEELFHIYGKRLYHFSLGYLKSKPDAEEIVQEVFLRIWHLRASLDPGFSFNAYLFKIAYRLIMEKFRKLTLERRYLADISAEVVTFTDELNDRTDYHSLLELVQRSINRLPPRQKEVLLMRRSGGMAVADIAENLGISPKTVEHHLTEALKNIKAWMNRDQVASMLFFYLFLRELPFVGKGSS
ncbi:MAG TPA: RNA polymerase sigma-70 factor [Prolixibacteraceae bacterium]|nr:RNA polymerase sigma-70 factor [Prolixibacteraceae bacterium]HOS00708.1 RNA polymerase sigma-70 factor [Prolixibacteraceae bacterium]HOS90344.1 RNA polymerase sigma-70 factor [Prolixibacteraceae bacterium]HPL44861.1 RNA polymerase sigma-70 factor [Prolixibacteraceae bacterium]HQE52465.1 RNA polymerase sigma-70 factor [Prolixibacteraceae bacterium]